MGYCEVFLVVLIVASVRCQEQNETSDVSSETSSLPLTNTEEIPQATLKSTQQKLDSQDESHLKIIHSSKKRVLDHNEIIPLEESTDNDFIEAIIKAEDQLLKDINYSSASEDERNGDDDHHHEKGDETALPSEGRIHFHRDSWPQFQRTVSQQDSWPQFQRRVSQQDSWPQLQRRVSQQEVDFDDSRQEKPYSNRRTLNGRQTIRDSTGADGRPLLQLTQGGYSRPYLGVTRPQRQEITQPLPESGPDNEEDSKQDTRNDPESNPTLRTPQPQIVPVSAYGQPFGSFPNVQSYPSSFFGPQQNAVPMSDFGNNFQQQFLVGNDVAGYPGFARNPSPAGEFQGAPISSFPNAGYILQQDRPQLQPVLPGYQQQPQFVPVAGFPGFETLNDAARPDYSAFFRPPSQSPAPRFYSNDPGMFTNNAGFNLNYPVAAPPYSSRFLRHPSSDNVQNPVENAVDSQDSKAEQEQQKQQEDNRSGREDEYTRDSSQDSLRESKDESVPFGARLRNQGPPFDNVFIRYPLTEAGYGTPEHLPRQNGTGEFNASDSGREPPRLFLGGPPRLEYPFPRGRDPYREALNALQHRQNESGNNNNRTSSELPSRQFAPAAQFVRPPPGHSQGIPNEAFFGYPDRSQDIPGLATFFPGRSGNELRSGFPFLNSHRPPAFDDPSKAPECARKTNASMCFEDENYPRKEVLYSLSTNSYILERLVGPGLGGPDDLSSEEEDSKADQEDFVCKVDLKRGRLLRAVNALGLWKVVVDADPSLAGGRFTQPVRLETCREAEEPCNYTNSRVKTKCVQKATLQRLLAWDTQRGIHVDLFRLPVACSCQVLEAPET